LFSRNPGEQKDPDQDIDWLDDLKFYIDNDDEMLSTYILPAVAQQKKQQNLKHRQQVHLVRLKVQNKKLVVQRNNHTFITFKKPKQLVVSAFFFEVSASRMFRVF
jgi:hypothetical protein